MLTFREAVNRAIKDADHAHSFRHSAIVYAILAVAFAIQRVASVIEEKG